MAANIESLFYVGREVPWHGLGQSVECAPTSEEAIRLAGLDWNVVQEEVRCSSGIITGYKANIRDIDRKVLGLVTDRYRIVQNKDAFAFTDSLLGDGVTYETAGSLASGKRIWLLARMEGRMLTGENFDPYLVFTNSHDGTGAIKVAMTTVRVVCQNTLNLALKSADRHWSCVHTGDINGKLEDAKNTLLNAHHYLDELEEEFGELKMQKLTKDKVVEYINTMFPIDDADTDRKKGNIIVMRNELLERYENAPDLQDIEESAYRFVNAVSDFATHTKLHRNTANYQENLFMKTIDGNALIDMAYKMVKTA